MCCCSMPASIVWCIAFGSSAWPHSTLYIHCTCLDDVFGACVRAQLALTLTRSHARDVFVTNYDGDLFPWLFSFRLSLWLSFTFHAVFSERAFVGSFFATRFYLHSFATPIFSAFVSYVSLCSIIFLVEISFELHTAQFCSTILYNDGDGLHCRLANCI